MHRHFDWRSFDADALVTAKREKRISVCIPARDEAATVADVVRVVSGELMKRHGLVDELVVVDDGSVDLTAGRAQAAGATVVSLPEGHGKGEAMWHGLRATTGDLVVYCDADVYDFAPRFVLGLLGPLITNQAISLVKGTYQRPLDGVPGEGGRVTELVAKPLIALLFPELGWLRQPLAGEWAARREVLEAITFASGYEVELGVLLEVASLHGADSIAECDLGERRHRNRPLAELRPQAEAIIRLALEQSGLLPTR